MIGRYRVAASKARRQLRVTGSPRLMGVERVEVAPREDHVEPLHAYGILEAAFLDPALHFDGDGAVERREKPQPAVGSRAQVVISVSRSTISSILHAHFILTHSS